MTSPKVTVLMPVFNGTSYVREAIESVLAQTYIEFEFLIIDDASTDESASVIESYKDERIRLVKNESNIGQVRSLNKGLHLARGAFIARLDQDDSCLMTRLERQAAVLGNDAKIAIVGTWLQIIDGSSHAITIWAGRLDDYADFVYTSLANRLMLYHPSVMFRRDVVLRLGGYDETMRYAEDQDLWRRIALAGYDARIIPSPLVCYRLHEGQQSVTRAVIQQRSAEIGRERFVKAFSTESASQTIQYFFERHREFWVVLSSPSAARKFSGELEQMVGVVRDKLPFSPSQARKLERLICGHAARSATSAWMGGIRSQLFNSWPIFVYSLRDVAAAALNPFTWAYPFMGVAAFVLVPLCQIKKWGVAVARQYPAYIRLRSWGSARKSALLGFWYARVKAN